MQIGPNYPGPQLHQRRQVASGVGADGLLVGDVEAAAGVEQVGPGDAEHQLGHREQLVVRHGGARSAQGAGHAPGRAEHQRAVRGGAGGGDQVGLGLGEPGEQRDLAGQPHALGEALDDGLARRQVGGDAVELGEEVVELLEQHGLEQHVLVGVGAVERAAADPRRAGDVLDVGPADAVLLEDLARRLEHRDASQSLQLARVRRRAGTAARSGRSARRSRRAPTSGSCAAARG